MTAPKRWTDAGMSARKIERNAARANGTLETAPADARLSVRGQDVFLGDERVPPEAEITMPARLFAAHLALAHLEARQLEASTRKGRTVRTTQVVRDASGKITGAVSVEG